MRWLALIITVLLPSGALAQDWNCDEWTNLPQQGMNMCSFQDYQRADRALNIVWPRVRAHLQIIDENTREFRPDETKGEENLLKAQRAWIDYRDGHCEAQAAQYTGGSIQPLIINSCKASLTRKRTEELLLMLEEG